MKRPSRLATLLLSGSLVLAAGCATVPRDPAARAEFEANHDPIEPLNRRIFAFNLFIDRILLKPLAKGYRRDLPEQVRDALRHFLDNLHEPEVFANTLLQGRLKAAGETGCRFLINSTAGLAGLEDIASRQKFPKQVGDFGQTLWTWGLPEGPYLILPVIGPSSPRDGIGRGVDIYFDPVRYLLRGHSYSTDVNTGRAIVDAIDQRARNLDSLDELQREAIDFYASFRSLYRQHRAVELGGGAPAVPPPDFYQDPGR